MARKPDPSARLRDWSSLAAGTRRRWVGAYGGPTSLGPAARRARAERAYESGAHLPREHTGHAPRTESVFNGVATTNGVETVVGLKFWEQRALGQYAHDTRALLRGEMTDQDFERRWSRRKLQIGPDVTLVADPRRVRAMWAQHGPVRQPFYERRRAA